MYHNNTPASVLEAPKQTVKTIHAHTGPNRRERRHGYTQTGKHFIVPAEYREPATNVPFVKEDDDSEAQV